MDISEIRVKLVRNSKERLKAVCSVTFSSEFVIRDLKVIEGTSGLFVAMPSRKLADHCPKCRTKNHLRARFCNVCGQKLDERRADRVRGGRARLHADVAHPINSDCRNRIQAEVVQAYEQELERSKEPGYQPLATDDLDADPGTEYETLVSELKKDAQERQNKRSQWGENDEPTTAATGTADDADRSSDAQVEPSGPSVDSVSEPASAPAATDDNDFGTGIV